MCSWLSGIDGCRWQTVVGGRGVGAAGNGHQERRTQPAGAEEQDERRGPHEGVRQGGSERCVGCAYSHTLTCREKNRVTHPLTLKMPHHSPAAVVSASASHTGRNPCQVNNGGCSQLCFPTSENSRSCSCTVGYNLRSDRMSCEGTLCNWTLGFTQHASLCTPYLLFLIAHQCSQTSLSLVNSDPDLQ